MRGKYIYLKWYNNALKVNSRVDSWGVLLEISLVGFEQASISETQAVANLWEVKMSLIEVISS